MVSDQTQKDGSFDSAHQNDIKIVEIESHQQLNIKEAEKLLNEGVALYNFSKYQEAIECYQKATSITPKDDKAWYNKGLALQNLSKYQEIIECYEKAISVNPEYDAAWSNKGFSLIFTPTIVYTQVKEIQRCYPLHILDYSEKVHQFTQFYQADSLLELGNKQEAKKYYFDALQIGSNKKDYIQKQLSKL